MRRRTMRRLAWSALVMALGCGDDEGEMQEMTHDGVLTVGDATVTEQPDGGAAGGGAMGGAGNGGGAGSAGSSGGAGGAPDAVVPPSCADTECPTGAACTDTEDGPQCACGPGTEDDGSACVDIDGCAGEPCGAGETCVDEAAPDDGHSCEDTDGCADAQCSDGTQCVDRAAPDEGHDCMPLGPATNTPAATLTVMPFDATSMGLTVASSNIMAEPSADRWYEQWYAVIENQGSGTLCHVQAEVDFLRAGAIVAEHYGFADADPYLASTDLPIACIAPGERGVVYSNGFAAANLDPATVDAIEVIVVGSDYGTMVPHPLTPTYTSMIQDWSVAGTVTAGAGDVYNLSMTIFPYDDNGLVFDDPPDFHLDPLYQGSTWGYMTSPAEAPFTEYEQYISFLPGTGATAALVVDGGKPSAEAVQEAAARRRRAELERNRTLFEAAR